MYCDVNDHYAVDPYLAQTVFLMKTTGIVGADNNTILDSSPNSYTFTKSGSVAPGKVSPFNGIGGSITTLNTFTIGTSSNVAQSGNFALEFWVYRTGTASFGASLGNETTGRVSFFVETDGRLAYNLYGSTTSYIGSATVSLNTWTFVKFERVGTTLTGYINNSSTGSISVSGTIGNTGGFNMSNSSGIVYFSNLRLSNTSRSGLPVAPFTSDTNTVVLLKCENAAIFDATAKNNIETIGNTSISNSYLQFGQPSPYFDGSGDYLITPASTNYILGTSDFTIEFWFKPTSRTVQYPILVSNALSWASGSWQICDRHNINPSKLGVFINSIDSGYGMLFSTTTISNGNSYFIQFKRSGSSFSLAVNGTTEATYTSSTSIGDGTTRSIVIGYGTGGCDYNGNIFDLRITKGIARPNAFPTQPF